jgi:hypothetical protein
MNSSFPQRARWVSTLLAVMMAAAASAQTSGGAIRGTVSDPSGAMVPGAGITIEEVSTSESWRLVSSSAGLYNAPNLPVGRYNVTVKARGFSTAERTNIEVQVGSERVVNVRLALGKSEEKVTVASQAATVDLTTSQTGAVNSGEVVRELPFQQVLDNHTFRPVIEGDLAEAKGLGVTTTPTLFVGIQIIAVNFDDRA